MKKLITKVIGVSLGLAMALGVGVAVGVGAQDVAPVHAATSTVSWAATNDALGSTITTVGGTATGTIYLTDAGGSTSYPMSYNRTLKSGSDYVAFSSSCIQLGKNGGVENVEFTTSSVPGTISSISVECASYSGSHKVSISVDSTTYLASTATSSWTTVEAKRGTGSSSGAITISFTDGSRALYVKSISVTYEESSGATVTGLEVLDDGANELSDGDEVNLDAVSALSISTDIMCGVAYDGASSDGDVDISSNKSSGFAYSTEDNETYTLTFSENGDYEITIAAHQDNNYSITVTYHISGIPSFEYELFTGTIATGDYVIMSGDASYTYVLGNTVASSRIANGTAPNVVDSKITNPSDSYVWHIAKSGVYWTIQNASNDKYLGGTNSKNQAALLDDATSDLALWSISYSSGWVFYNLGRSEASSDQTNAYLRNNTTLGWACYLSATGNAPALFKLPSTDPAIEVEVTGSTSLGVGETATLTVTKLNGATGTVNWATSDSSALSLSATTGDSVTVTAGSTLGSAVITASLTGCDDVQTSFIIRGGTAVRPYTVAEAKAAIDSGEGVNDVYVAGIISQIDSYNSTYSSITYWISDDGSTTNQFEVYSGKGVDGADFDSESDIKVGAIVVVRGNIQKHEEKYEFNYNSIITSYTYDESSAIKHEVELLNSFASLSYNYETTGNAVLDLLNNANTIGERATNYGEWTSETTIANYTGNSAGGSGTIQLRSSDNSGIVVSSKTNNDNGLFAKKIYIKWNTTTTDGRALDVYGKNEQYSQPSDLYGDEKGANIAEFVYSKTGSAIQVVTITGDYEYIGIKSKSGALFLDSIVIQWGEASYTYDDVAIRLGGKIEKDLWNNLNTSATIEGYGVLLSNADYLGETELKTKYDSVDNTNVKKFDMPLATKAPVEDGDYYYWNLYKGVTNALTTDFVAVAYIRTSNGVVFLKQVTASAKSLANDYLGNNPLYDLDAFEGSLANLACK